MTKEEIKEYNKKWYILNKSRIAQNKKEYYDNKKYQILQKRISYYILNKTKITVYNSSYYQDKKEKILGNKKNFYLKNKNKLNNKAKIYYKKNKLTKKYKKQIYKNRHYTSKRSKVDSLFKLSINIRGLISSSIRNNGFKKNNRSNIILGCSFEFFKQYIEKQFEIWMNWNNHGIYTGNYNQTWQYDHIIPISSAKTNEEIIKLNHYTNFRPLCSKLNNEKRNKIQ